MTEPGISQAQTLNRLREHLPTLERVIQGLFPPTNPDHNRFLDMTSAQRESWFIREPGFQGQWHESLVQCIVNFLEAWCERQVGGSLSVVSHQQFILLKLPKPR